MKDLGDLLCIACAAIPVIVYVICRLLDLFIDQGVI